ncbi:MAG: 4-hydroxythreonine-4-phosphate dehydrogenase PdxA, partial [Armatimonadota bacterium]
MNSLPRIVITMGDPAGIGPEVIVKALCDDELRRSAQFLIVGNYEVFAQAQKIIQTNLPLVKVAGFEDPSFQLDNLNILDAVDTDFRKLALGKPSPESGKAAAQAIEIATRMALNREADALVTAPIS